MPEVSQHQRKTLCHGACPLVSRGDVEANYLAATLAHRLGDEEDAARYYGRLFVRAELDRSIPYAAAAHADYATLLAARGELEKSVAHFKRASKRDPANQLASQRLPEVMLLLAGKYIKSGQRKDAETMLRNLTSMQQDNAEAQNYLGVALWWMQRQDEAIACFETAVRRNTRYAEAFNNLGTVLAEQKQFRLAEFNFRQALEIRPDYELAKKNLEQVLQDKTGP